MAYDDGKLHEAIGWMAGSVGGPTLAQMAHTAIAYGEPEIGKYLMGWADINAGSLTSIDFADRRRHRAARYVVEDAEIDADEYDEEHR